MMKYAGQKVRHNRTSEDKLELELLGADQEFDWFKSGRRYNC